MLGNELNPTVMTEQVGFEEVPDAREGVRAKCREGGHLDERGKQRQWGLTKGHGDKGGFVGLGEREKRGVQLV